MWCLVTDKVQTTFILNTDNIYVQIQIFSLLVVVIWFFACLIGTVI